MNFLKTILIVALISIGSGMSAQTVIQIAEDTVFDETQVFTEDTILEGVGLPTVTFNGAPKFKVVNCRVLIKNMRIPVKKNWGTIEGDGILEWYGIGMEGSIQKGTETHSTFLDGKER